MNKLAVVTGATRGIGKAIALKLVESGFEVHGVYHTSNTEAENLQKTKGILFHQANLADRSSRNNLIADISRLKIDALVNDAGIWEADNLENWSLEVWDKTIELNLTAPLDIAIRLKSSFNSGASVINIASTDGLIGAFDGLSYSASKSALINLTKSLGNYFGPKGIRVNAIAPGWIDTDMISEGPTKISEEMTPLSRNGKPEEIASVVEFLISEKASYINGETINVDGGLINVDYVLKKESE
jgi:3-oxoacyl-[acyl-carrier protein] reductase